MHCQRSYKVRMSFKCTDLFHGVVVVDTNKVVIRANSDPLLSCYELRRSYGRGCHLEGFYCCLFCSSQVGYLGIEIVDIRISAVQSNQHPRKSRMNVNRLYLDASDHQLLLHFQLQWLLIGTKTITISFNN